MPKRKTGNNDSNGDPIMVGDRVKIGTEICEITSLDYAGDPYLDNGLPAFASICTIVERDGKPFQSTSSRQPVDGITRSTITYDSIFSDQLRRSILGLSTSSSAFHGLSGGVSSDDTQDEQQRTQEPKPKAQKTVSMDSVILPAEKKEAILAALSQVKNHDQIFDKWGFDQVFEKGTAVSLLFWGIPGTGKTLAAQAIADSFGAELKTIGAAEIETAEPGGAERNIQKVFAEATEANKDDIQQVILFDECDSLLMDRNAVGPIIGATINCLLSEIEKFKGIVIFTTNRLGKLDAALERRISAKIEFSFPDQEQRELIWKRMIPKKAPLEKDVDPATLATYAIAGGNIKNAVLTAARSAAHNKQKKIRQEDFVKAIEQELNSLDQFRKQIEANDRTRPLVDFIANGRGLQLDRTSKEHALENLSQTEYGQEIRRDIEETETKLRLLEVGIQGRVN